MACSNTLISVSGARLLCSCTAAVIVSVFPFLNASADNGQPIQGGVSTTTTRQTPAVYVPEYNYPKFIPKALPKPQPPKPKEKPKEKPKILNASASMMQPQQPKPAPQPPAPKPMAPLKAGTTVNRAPSAPPGVLPNEFLGQWSVLGNRQGIQALPQYGGEVGKIFAPTTSDTWIIRGNPQQGYTLTTSTGVTTGLQIGRCQGSTAWIRYSHPIRNTSSIETICMQLAPGGASFSGSTNIAIQKAGERQPRCQVKYSLSGRRN